MRLSCPNCGAQYEVPDDVIPQAGRDVQCSNCGHTWFQGPPEEDVSLTEELGGSVPVEDWTPEDIADDVDVEPEIEPEESPPMEEEEVQPPSVDLNDEEEDIEPEVFVEPHSEVSADFEENDVDNAPDDLDDAIGRALSFDQETTGLDDVLRDTADEPDVEETSYDDDLEEDDWEEQTSDFDDEDLDDIDEAPEKLRKSLNPEIAEILREEAEHEARVRAEEASVGLESQPDLGLSAPQHVPETNKRAREARERMRRLRGIPAQEPEQDAEPDPVQDHDIHASRRDLLPDIEEINSSLRATEDREYAASEEPAIFGERQRRRGFRLGFALVLLVAAGALLVYVYHEQISASAPEAAPYIDTYLENANSARVWLDEQVTKMMLALQNAAGSGASGEN
ncbi:family finger-like domain protein [Shimia thalassica]|uniref:Family finger-like domain protein n=1 Tax=Shimia thalassica TaxID=1715693 RepID=A0A0P1IU08_9RHOB|nr:zinc-ribbon domain-containing protein [Shimia thalassica]CUK05763.1 family finger-like domain protein [Shimia thalassica]